MNWLQTRRGLPLLGLLYFAVLGCNQGKSVAWSPPEGGSTTNTLDGTAKPTDGQTAATTATTPGTTAAATSPTPGATGSTESTTPSPAPPVEAPKVSSNAVTLRLNFTKGDVLKFKTTSESKTLGQQEVPAMTISVDQVLTVNDVQDSVATVQTKLEKFKMSGPGIDGNKEADKASTQVSDVKFTGKYDSLGTVSNFEISGNAMMGTLAAGVGSSVGFMGVNYPSKEVKVGDTWKITWDFQKVAGKLMAMMGNADWSDTAIPTIYTLKSLDSGANKAVITFSSTGAPKIKVKVSPPAQSKDKPAPKPVEMTSTINISASGTMTIDLKTGYPLEIVSETASEVKGAGASGGSMKQVSKSTVKRV